MRGSDLGLEVYADADYADKTNDRRSVSGIAITLGGAVVSLASKTQRVVSLSTSEAEYIAARDGTKEALLVRAVLSPIAPEMSGVSIKVLEDNRLLPIVVLGRCFSVQNEGLTPGPRGSYCSIPSRRWYLLEIVEARLHGEGL